MSIDVFFFPIVSNGIVSIDSHDVPRVQIFRNASSITFTALTLASLPFIFERLLHRGGSTLTEARHFPHHCSVAGGDEQMIVQHATVLIMS